jgi:hypothetical protein
MRRTMTVTELNFRRALVLAACLASVLDQRALAGEKPVPDDRGLSARVDQRIQAWQPTREERRLDDIGWARDIRDALRLARQHGRPIFLFTYSGSTNREHAMALQRC